MLGEMAASGHMDFFVAQSEERRGEEWGRGENQEVGLGNS